MSRALTPEEIAAFRTTLCEVATRRFAELGYDGVTMRGLAAEVGCSPMTPYRYFQGKEEIFAAVRAAAFKRLSDRCESAMASAPNEIVGAARIGQTYLRFALDEPDAYKIMFELSQPDDEDYPELAEQVDRSRHFLEQPTRVMVEAGILSGDPEKLAQVFWAGIHGVIVLHLSGKLGPDTDVSELFSMVSQIIAQGARGPNFDRLTQATAAAA